MTVVSVQLRQSNNHAAAFVRGGPPPSKRGQSGRRGLFGAEPGKGGGYQGFDAG